MPPLGFRESRGIAAPIALFMGLRARAEIREAPSKFSNASDATLGIFLGALGVVLVLIGFAGWVVGNATAPQSPRSVEPARAVTLAAPSR
jgi:hypothetical protein